MLKYDIAMIGHITKDKIKTPDNKPTQSYGGAVLYSSASAANSKASVIVITKATAEDRCKVDFLHDYGICVCVLNSDQTTTMELNYLAKDQEKREIKLIAKADSFFEEDIQGISANIYHLAGLLRGEIPCELITSLSRRGLVAFDVQGVLRHNQGGRLVLKNWENKEKYLPMITYLKTDAAEAEILTGTDDRRKAAEILNGMGANEVMITHNQELLVFADDQCYTAPFTAENLSGRTGRGDTCFAAYLAWRLKHSIRESVVYAAALTSIKMEHPGIFNRTYTEVMERIEKDYSDGYTSH